MAVKGYDNCAFHKLEVLGIGDNLNLKKSMFSFSPIQLIVC